MTKWSPKSNTHIHTHPHTHTYTHTHTHTHTRTHARTHARTHTHTHTYTHTNTHKHTHTHIHTHTHKYTHTHTHTHRYTHTHANTHTHIHAILIERERNTTHCLWPGDCLKTLTTLNLRMQSIRSFIKSFDIRRESRREPFCKSDNRRRLNCKLPVRFCNLSQVGNGSPQVTEVARTLRVFFFLQIITRHIWRSTPF